MSECPICASPEAPQPKFRVAFPDFGLGGRAGFTLDEDPGVPFWTICRCPACTVQYAWPRPTRDELASAYANNGSASEWEWIHYIEPTEQTRHGWAEFAERVTRLNGDSGYLLDIGCAAGWLLKGARDLGWAVMGLEPRPPFAEYANRTLNLPVIHGDTSKLDSFARRSFHIVCATDVIEHLQDPVADLQAIRRVIRPDGHLVLATCDIESPDARRYGIRWRQVVISHTFYWTRKAMTIALNRAGFEVQSFSAFRYWDPRPVHARWRFIKECAKYAVKRAIAAAHFPARLADRIGQPVLGDVMLAVATPMSSRNRPDT